VQIRNSEWSLAFFESLFEDKRFFESPLFKYLPEKFPHYDIAVTIKYYEDPEVREHIALAPMPCYASFPLSGEGLAYDKLRKEVVAAMPDSILEWEEGDWAVGVPYTVSDKYTYQILKDFESKVIREKDDNNYKERCYDNNIK